MNQTVLEVVQIKDTMRKEKRGSDSEDRQIQW